ncbi:hypothetical protein OQX61_21510, partial [Pedobacter sp. PLR]|nr:hypothetical protein [Pedobacter sp. PLR]
GVAGPIGVTGATGVAGPIGVTGADGVQGLKGDKGDIGATGVAGPIGVTGADGVQGLKGDKGDTGATGVAGPIGVTGADGIQGLKGDKGDTGAPMTASNGLTSASGDITLGGTLTKATTVATSSTNTLAVSGLQAGTTATNKIVTASTTGVLTTVEFGEHKSYTTALMNLIASPSPGRTIYNSTEKSLYTYDGTNWVGQNSQTFNSFFNSGFELALNVKADLTNTFTLAGKQNVMVTASFVPQCQVSTLNGTTSGECLLLIDGVAQDSRRYSTINSGTELYRYSSVVTWSGSLNPGSHTIIFRVIYTGGNTATNAEDRRMDIFVK